MNIILLGAPGAGKGTVAVRLFDKYHIPHISTGDIFRQNIKDNTELGKLAKSYMDKGALVPDDVTIRLILDRLSNDDCKDGYILDGFPRTIKQAEDLKSALLEKNEHIDLAILIEADDEKLIHRLSGRRVCEGCGASYHIETMKPKVEGICDRCGKKLIQRKDDSENIVRDRLMTYEKETKPLIEFYRNEKNLISVNGFSPIDDIIGEISKHIS